MIVEQVEDEQEGRTKIKYKQYGEDRWRSSRFRPYFYVAADEHYRLPDDVEGFVQRDPGVAAYDGTELHRVVLDTTRAVGDARGPAGNHFEADIPFDRRYYIDEVEGALTGTGDIDDTRPHIAHLDIEVDATGAFPEATDAEERVISVSIYSEELDSHLDLLLKPPGWDPGDADADVAVQTDEKGREYIVPDWDEGVGGDVYLFDTEQDLLGSLGRVIKQAGIEVLAGWNVLEFDAAYLINRMEDLEGISEAALSPLGEAYVSEWTTNRGNQRLSVNLKGVDVFDMDDAYRHLRRRDKPPNWRLGTVAKHEDIEADKIPFDTSNVGNVWREDPLSVMEYNRRDAILTHQIAEEMSVFEQFLEVHRSLAVPLEDTLKNSVLVEMFVMSRAPAWGIHQRVLDSKRSMEDNDFEGGNTKDPNEGRYEWVFSADVTSEYPNWVRAANLSPETVVTRGDTMWDDPDLDLIDTPKGGIKVVPHEERLGILPRAVDEMFQMKAAKTDKRAQYEYGTEAYEQADLERDVTKWLLNSIQGVTGMETHRLSKNEVSASITAFGRETVEEMRRIGESMGYEFVYADTDSAFFHDPDGGVASLEGVVEAVQGLAERTNGRLPEWAQEEFGVPEGRAQHLEVEPDKVARRAFFPNKKKRYTLWLVWDDGTELDKISHTGWGIVRSDLSAVEHEIQEKTLEAVIHNRSERYVTARLKKEIERAARGERDPFEVARPQGCARPFHTYGDSDDGGDGDLVDGADDEGPREGEAHFDNVPYFVAAMLSSNELLGTDFSGGDKAWMLPVKETETVELNGTTNRVNYLAIREDTDLPDWVEVDYAKVTKDMIGKVERIYESLGWDTSALVSARRKALDQLDARRVQSKHKTLGAF